MMRSIYRRGHNPWRPMNSIWQDMRRFQHELDYLFGGTSGPLSYKFPAMNAWLGDEGATLTVALPGVDPEKINLTIEGKRVTISGERPGEEIPEQATRHLRERESGPFSRSLELPFKVDSESVEASFRNGILKVVLPRLPEEQPKKISVSLA